MKPTDVAGDSGKRATPVTGAKPLPLPLQAYTADGEKIPYVAQTNPYNSSGADIPQAARSAFNMANARLDGGNVKGAQEGFISLTENYPALSGPWLRLGEIAEQLELYDEAIGHYEKAISVNRNNVSAYLRLGLLQRRQGNFRAAENAYAGALHVWKDCPQAHLNLAILQDLYLNRPEDAQRHYEAYAFLAGMKDKKANKWLVEVRQRTGIDRSYVDNPPKEVAGRPAAATGEDSVTATAGGSG
ncbi:MAG: tetratricopeptide repeat protein [Thiohalobacterales bacterium]|nr:tetratricopeptide repeat protein [Thiohalobacterales bacterium]